MDAELFAEELGRMCKSYGCSCSGCGVMDLKPDDGCIVALAKNPKEFVAIVERWSNEHPRKTNRDKFFEVFGIDPRPAGYVTNHNRAEGLATEWWDRSYEEPKER